MCKLAKATYRKDFVNCNSELPPPLFRYPSPLLPVLRYPPPLPIVSTSMYRVPSPPLPSPYSHPFILFIPRTIICTSSQPGIHSPIPISSHKRRRESQPFFTHLDIFITLAPSARPPSTPLLPFHPHNHFPFVLIAHSSLDNTHGHAASV